VKKTLITISGPTAVGKTKFSIDLANLLGCDIVSCDSRQFYKEMYIGTAVPSKNELKAIKHHCIQHKSVLDNYNIKDFEKDALKIINNEFLTKDYVVMVGGSGMYMDAVTVGLDDFPEINDEIRKKLNLQFNKKGISFLQKKLKELDPEYYKKVDIQNPRRLIRSLEVCVSSRKPYSSFIGNNKKNHSFDILNFGLEMNRNLLYDKINLRVDLMIKNELINEVKGLINFKNLNALNTVGYKEVFNYLDNKTSIEYCVEEIKKNTRRYAKRQITWLKSKNNIVWIKSNESALKIKTNYLDFK
tara:strand:- start:4561 stop:5463 length:903 start_codon:yes stop_codon:yes gene_type:complete